MLQIILLFVLLLIAGIVFTVAADRIDRALYESRITQQQWRVRMARLFFTLVMFLAGLICGLLVTL